MSYYYPINQVVEMVDAPLMIEASPVTSSFFHLFLSAILKVTASPVYLVHAILRLITHLLSFALSILVGLVEILLDIANSHDEVKELEIEFGTNVRGKELDFSLRHGLTIITSTFTIMACNFSYYYLS